MVINVLASSRFFQTDNNIVTPAERLFRVDLHAQRVDQRHRPEIGLRRALKQQFIPEQLGSFRRRPVLGHRAIGQRVVAVQLRGCRRGETEAGDHRRKERCFFDALFHCLFLLLRCRSSNHLVHARLHPGAPREGKSPPHHSECKSPAYRFHKSRGRTSLVARACDKAYRITPNCPAAPRALRRDRDDGSVPNSDINRTPTAVPGATRALSRVL